MSIMTLFRRAFGFSPDTEEEEGEYDPTVPTYAVGNQTSGSTASAVATAPEGETPHGESAPEKAETMSIADESLPADIFDAVIEIFNQAQPEFVRECLNVEAQRQYIFNSLSESLRGRVKTALASDNREWEKEKSELEKRIAELEGDDNEISRLRKDNKRLQLSVDRQKRALLDRINDLETQVVRQSEEKERFYSRKRIPESEELAKANARVKELEEESVKLAAEINDLRNSPEKAPDSEGETPAAESASAELEQCQAELERQKEAFGQATAAWAEEKATLEAERDTLKEEVSRQITLREQLEMKTSMSDVMINDLRNQAASARGELERFQHEQEEAMEQIREQLDGFEELKARKDAKISELQESNTSLRRTIETNLYNQANSEMKLRREIKDLKAELEKLSPKPAPEAVAAPVSSPSVVSHAPVSAAAAVSEGPAEPPRTERPARRRGRPKKVRIDSDLDNTEWFAGAKHDDPDFGYHEPPRRPVNDNEAQLSLF